MVMALPRLFIDWLDLTIAVEPERQSGVQERLSDASERWPDNLTNPPARGRYRYRYTLSAGNGHSITIKAQPTSSAANYLKLEYSPENIGAEGTELLASYLSFVLGPEFRDDFYRGQANRVDITFDVRRLALHDLWITDTRLPAKASAIIRGPDLQAETLYFGYKSYRQLIVYDKNAERGRPRNTIPWIRFEYRYGKGDYPLCDLLTGLKPKNPFHSFEVRRFARLPQPNSLLQSRLLFDACRLRGRESVIASVPESEREQLRQAISSFPPWKIWARRNTIWNTLRQRIAELLPADTGGE
jgi:hypothetical protein